MLGACAGTLLMASTNDSSVRLTNCRQLSAEAFNETTGECDNDFHIFCPMCCEWTRTFSIQKFMGEGVMCAEVPPFHNLAQIAHQFSIAINLREKLYQSFQRGVSDLCRIEAKDNRERCRFGDDFIGHANTKLQCLLNHLK